MEITPRVNISIKEEKLRKKANANKLKTQIIDRLSISLKLENIHRTLKNGDFSGFCGFDRRMLKL
jgi:hypothetical protein